MKKIILCFLLFYVFGCNDKTVLLEKKLISKNKYLIVCKGYPREGASNPIQVKLFSKNAALLNAQFIARKIFKDEFNVVKFGNVDRYELYNDYAVVYYILKSENIEKFLK